MTLKSKISIMRVNTVSFYITVNGKAVGTSIGSYSKAQLILEWFTKAYTDLEELKNEQS